MKIFTVKFTVICKPGWFRKNTFKFDFPAIADSYTAVTTDISEGLHQFPWRRLQFIEYTQPDVQLIKDYASDSDVIRISGEFDRRTAPVFRKMHKRNGTLDDNNNSGGGRGFRPVENPQALPAWARAAIGWQVGRGIGKLID